MTGASWSGSGFADCNCGTGAGGFGTNGQTVMTAAYLARSEANPSCQVLY